MDKRENFVNSSSQVELQQLEYFVSVAENLNYRKAAEELYVTQPLLSQQIHKLETALGTNLLERDTKHVSLTTSGEYLYKQAKHILEKVEVAVSETKKIAETSDMPTNLHLSCDVLYDISALTNGITQCQNRWPNIKCDIRIEQYISPLNIVENQKADIAFILSEDPGKIPEGFVYKKIRGIQFDCIFPRNGSCPGKETESDIALIKQLPLLIHECDSQMLAVERGICEQNGFSPTVSFQNSIEDVIIGVELGEGFAILPDGLRYKCTGRHIRRFSFKPELAQNVSYYSFWKENNNKRNAIEKLVDVIIEKENVQG